MSHEHQCLHHSHAGAGHRTHEDEVSSIDPVVDQGRSRDKAHGHPAVVARTHSHETRCRKGVAPNAVYTYFPNKAAVLQGVVERILGEVEHDAVVDQARPWRSGSSLSSCTCGSACSPTLLRSP